MMSKRTDSILKDLSNSLSIILAVFIAMDVVQTALGYDEISSLDYYVLAGISIIEILKGNFYRRRLVKMIEEKEENKQ